MTQQKQKQKAKAPFLLRFQTQKPIRSISLNKLNFKQQLRAQGTFISKRFQIQNQLWQHHIVQNNIRIQGLLKKFHAICIHYKIPQFYSYFFMLQLIHCNQARIQDAILKQIHQIKERKSYYDIIINSIKARQSCLLQLSRCLQNQFNNQKDQYSKHYFKEEIQHYRKLTVYVIQHIKSWKDYLISLSEETQHIQFMVKAQNYLMTLLNDNQFIFKSFLSKHLHFSHKNDPFIMRPQIQGADSKFLDIFAYEQEQKLNYMALLRFLADQKAKNLQKLFINKNDRIKQIQDIYMRKHPNMGSSILIRKFHPLGSNKKYQSSKQIDLFGQAHHQVNSNLRLKPKNILETRNKKQNQSTVQKEEDPKQQQKRKRLSQFLQKNDKIKRIKAAFGQTSIINPKKLKYIKEEYNSDSENFKAKSLSARNNPIYDRQDLFNDSIQFEQMMRRKQMRILQQQRIKGSKVLKPIQRKIEKNKLFDNSQGIQQLQKVFNQLETNSPQKMKQYALLKPKSARQQISFSRVYMSNNNNNDQIQNQNQISSYNQSPIKLKKIPNLTKTLLQHNQQVVVQLRNRIIKQIQIEKQQKQKRQKQRRQQDQKVQQILKKKMDQQVLKALKSQKQKYNNHLIGKQQLANQFKSKQLFDYQDQELKKSKVRQLNQVQQQLKRQMQLKWLRDVQIQLKRRVQNNQIDKQKKIQQQILSKQYQQAKRKQYMEKRYAQIQIQERAKALKRQIELDQQRKREIQQQMKLVIEKEKAKLQEFTINQKVLLEGQLRQVMKHKLLQTLKRQREQQDQNLKKEKQNAKNQEQYRQQVKKKLEKEFEVEKQMQIVRKKQQKSAKVKVVAEKLQYLTNKMEETKQKQKIQKINKIKQLQQKQKNQKEIKILSQQLKEFPDLRQSAFTIPRISDHHKKQLRQQFQNQLFSFRNSQFYEKQKPTGQQFFVKDFKSRMKEDNFLQSKMQQIKSIQKQNDQRNNQVLNQNKNKNKNRNVLIVDLQKQIENDQEMKKLEKNKDIALSKLLKKQSEGSLSQKSDNFARFSERQKSSEKISNQIEKQKNEQTQIKKQQQIDDKHRIQLGMSLQQYKIYLKKKKVINQKRDWDQQRKKKYQQQQKKKIKKLIQDFQLLDMNPISNKKDSIQIIQQQKFEEKQQQDIFDPMEIKFKQQIYEKDIQLKHLKQEQKQLHQINKKDNIQNKLKEDQKDQKQLKIEQEIIKKQKPIQRLNKYIGKTIESQFSDSPSKRFLTSSSSQQEDQSQQKSYRKKKLINSKIKKQSLKKSKLRQKQKKSNINKLHKKQQIIIQEEKEQQPLIIKPVQIEKIKIKQNKVKLRFIAEQKLRQFLDDHFENLPRIIKKVNFFKRQDLFKQISKQHTFVIIQTIKNSLSLGLGIGVYNPNKKLLRSFDIIHIGSYEQQDYLQVLLSTAKYIFEHDPCEQVTFANIYDKESTDQNQYIKAFEKKFDSYGAIFQKKFFNTQFQRKYVLRRITQIQNKKKIQIMDKNYGNLTFLSQLFVSQKQIQSQFKYPISGQRIGSYGMLSLYLSQYKQKQIFHKIITDSDYKDKYMKHLCKMIMNLNIQKTKIRQILYKQYQNVFLMNLQFIRQGKDKQIIHCQQETIQNPNKIIRSQFKQEIPLCYENFKVSKAKFNIFDDQYQSKYIRYKYSQEFKSFTLKSNKFSSLVTVLPLKNLKYKLFILDSQQYDGINQQNRTPLDIYLKLFFANIENHKIAQWQHIWIPQIKTRQTYKVSEIQVFSQISEYSLHRDQFNFSYVDYMGNSLTAYPTHRDLFVNPPFIMGLLDVQIEKATEGSPFYIRRIDLNDLLDIKQVQKIIKQSD